jgi:hypothetical protein
VKAFQDHLGQHTDCLVAVVLFVGLSSLYFATVSGITSSNDGSHYALTRTMNVLKHVARGANEQA